jgi:glycosyltransferase involved in cell wall biosynthesis
VKVGIFDPYLDDIGGGERYMMSIAEYLSVKHKVVIFWDHRSDVDKIQEQFSLDLSRCEVETNIFSKSYGFLRRILETRRYDAIIILSDGSIPFVLSKKLFLHIQQPLSNMDDKSFKFKFKLSRVSKIFFNSGYSRSFVDPRIAQKGVVLYPPVPLNSKKVKKENIILHVGRFRARNVGATDYKKQDVMVAAFKKMVDQGFKDWKFILAVGVHDADKENFNRMQGLAKGYPIEFLINLNNKKLWEVYSKAKLYWHASGYGEDLKTHPEYAEHFGISTVEAMGARAVPIVINTGGQKEIVEMGINGFLWDTTDELMEKTNTIARDSKLWEKMSSEAAIRAKIFSKERFCKELDAILQ